MRSDWILRLITLWMMLDPLDAFSAVTTTKKSYLQTVTDWLDEEKITWQLEDRRSKLFPRSITSSQPVLEVRASNPSNSATNALYYLHLLKSPNDTSDCVSPTCTRDMTNYVQYMNTCSRREQEQLDSDSVGGEVGNPSKISLIHLHEDVWHSRTDIVQSRLRIRLLGHSGQAPSRLSRVFARKTVARRIDAGTAIPFLREHHLWSATKARFYYGLFLPPPKDDDQEDNVLVAVATFSSKRKILRGSRETRSHELLRFCTRADGVVVGGITKLVRAFIKEQEQTVDDIVTVVDRDWGPGDGWHSIGFETMHVMAPLVMVVKDGIRRHLVGAGIKIQQPVTGSKTNNESSGRPGVEGHVLEELEDLTTHHEALQCLEKHEYYPVYDAGVERLLMVLPKAQSGGAPELGKTTFVPSYAASYNSQNSGISVLLAHVMALTASSTYGGPFSAATITSAEKAKINDSMAAQHHTAAWKATGGTARNATLLYTAPSSLDSLATVEVRERPGGWCTLGIVGGATKSIYHGNFKLAEGDQRGIGTTPLVDSSILVSEYLRTMAAVALAALEFRQAHPESDSGIADDDNINNSDKEAPLSFLYLGYGAGSLPRFMASVIPGSRHVAIELDDGVVSAAHHCGLLRHSSSPDTSPIQLQLGDALTYRRSTNAATNTGSDSNKSEKHHDPFDVVFVDIFDGDNSLPKEFYSKAFLEHMYQNHLGGRPDGMVIHNFHTGGKALGARLEDAIKGYRRVFSTTLVVESVDSRHTGGNTILLAMNKRRLDASSETLSWHRAGRKAQQLWGTDFDVIARTTHKLWLS